MRLIRFEGKCSFGLFMSTAINPLPRSSTHLSLTLKCTHTHAHTRTYTHTLSLSLSLSFWTHTLLCSLHSISLSHTHTHIHTHIHTQLEHLWWTSDRTKRCKKVKVYDKITGNYHKKDRYKRKRVQLWIKINCAKT